MKRTGPRMAQRYLDPMESVWLGAEGTPTVPLDKSVCWTKVRRAGARTGATSTMTAPWVQPVSMGTAQIHAWALTSAGPMLSVKQCPMQPLANAQRAPESSILLM